MNEMKTLTINGVTYILDSTFFTSGEGVGSIVRVIHDPEESPLAQPTATGESAISLGRYCKVPGKNAMAVNYNNQVDGTYGFAANNGNLVGPDAGASSAFGSHNKIYAFASFVAGRLNQINQESTHAFAAGLGNFLSVPYGVVFGKYNDKLSKALFAIGNGKSNSIRSNAFEVFEDGSMVLDKERFTASELRDTISKTAMMAATMAPIIDTSTGEVAQVPLALSVKGLSLYGKTIQDGTPTPEAPVDIVSAGADGNITVRATGKNLCPVNEITFTDTQKTIATSIPAGTYYFSAKAVSNDTDAATCFVCFYHGADEEGVGEFYMERDKWVTKKVTFDKEVNRIHLYSSSLNVYGIGDTATYSDIMLSVEPPSSFEPYELSGILAVDTPNGLPGIPVTSGGNYTDESGQQWICDGIDLERGVYVQRVGRITLDGSEGWRLETGYTNLFSSKVINSNTSYTGLSDKMITAKVWSNLTSTPFSFGMRKTALTINLGDDINTVEAVQAWLEENTPTIMYALDQPVETPLEDLYKSAVYTFTEGDSYSIAVGFETDTWALRYRNSTGGRVFSKSTYIQGNTFSVPSSFVLEIKNDTPGIFDMVIDAEKSSSAAGAEVYYFSQAPADGWTDDVVNAFTPDSAEYVGLLDGAAGIDDLQCRKATGGNFFLLFKATDLDTNTSGPLRIYSLAMEQVPLEDCMANEPNLSVMAEGAGISVTYAADPKTYIDGKFTELQNAILAAGANV